VNGAWLSRVARLLAAAACFWGSSVLADVPGLDAELDLRLVAADTDLTSFTDGGLGELRFDEDHDGLRLGRLLLAYQAHLLETLSAEVALSATGDNDKNPIDVTEAFLEWRPYPRSMWRTRARLGAFYPPVSLENRRVGWQSLYSISPSALNTWVGEEIRTLGAEVEVTAAGASKGRSFDVSAVASVFGWNDPMGVLIFERGWAIHDRQTALFGRLPDPLGAGTTRHGLELFHEIDNRAGYYVGGEFRYTDRVVLRALHYDNRGDPAAMNEYESAWLTRFDSVGARIELPAGFTVVSQWMTGDTSVGDSDDGRGFLIADYDAAFLLVSKTFGRQRLTVRYDTFETDTVRNEAIFDGSQDGEAWTLAYIFEPNEHWRLAAEALRNDTTLAPRALLGLAPQAVERTLQLAVVYHF